MAYEMRHEEPEIVPGTGEPIIEQSPEIRKTLRMWENPSEVEKMSLRELENLKFEVEEMPAYQNYLRERVNFEKMDEILERFDSETQGRENESEVKNTREHIEREATNIKQAITRCYESYTATRGLQIQQFRESKEAYMEELEQRGTSQHIAHNALMDIILSFTIFCNEKQRDLGIAVINQTNWFTNEQLHNRDYIREWAISTEEGKRIAEVLRLTKNTIEEKQKKAH